MIKDVVIYLIFWFLSWALKSFADWGIKKSKTTENTFDDWFFVKFKIFVNIVTQIFIKKIKK